MPLSVPIEYLKIYFLKEKISTVIWICTYFQLLVIFKMGPMTHITEAVCRTLGDSFSRKLLESQEILPLFFYMYTNDSRSSSLFSESFFLCAD